MQKNIFFNLKDLKRIGKNVIIGKTVRIRYPELVEIGDNVIIDDFTYISTALVLNSFTHISSGCKIIGGRKSMVFFESFSTLSPNVVIAAGSDDYLSGIATPLVDEKFKGNVKYGTVTLGRHCIVGAGSVLLPNITMGTGSSVGALSLVNSSLDEWGLYAGIPAKKIKDRDRDTIIENELKFWQDVSNWK